MSERQRTHSDGMAKTASLSTMVTDETAELVELIGEIRGMSKSEYIREIVAHEVREDFENLDDADVRRALVALHSDEAEVEDDGRILPPPPHELLSQR